MTNTLGIMLEILSNYPWTRLSVRIPGVIKKQFFQMVTHVFDNRNFSQEIFAIDTWGAAICSLGHGGKHMLTILPTIWIGTRLKFNEDLTWRGNKIILFQVCFIRKIIDMLSLNHHLLSYTKLMTVLNKEDWQSMKYKSMSHHHLSLYTKLTTLLNSDYFSLNNF